MQKHKLGTNSELYRCADNSAKINAKWTNEELLLAVQGMNGGMIRLEQQSRYVK